MKTDKTINGNCWIAYFDFLGFKNLIETFTKINGEGNLDVFRLNYYDDIVRIAKKVVNKVKRINNTLSGEIGYSWFSDTFIFFAPEGKPGSYGSCISIDAILRRFFTGSLLKGNLFRGALSFGDFYANTKDRIFLGPALIDAYEYAEKQDWFGVVVSSKAIKKLKGTKFDIDKRADYANLDVPVKNVDDQEDIIQIKREKENLYAYRISKHTDIEKIIIQKQDEAQIENPDDYDVKYKPKYEEVLKFLRETKLRSVSN